VDVLFVVDIFAEEINSSVNFQDFSYELGDLFLCGPSKFWKVLMHLL